MIDHLIPKTRSVIELKLAHRDPEQVEVFLAAASATHAGAERVEDLLNGSAPFFAVAGATPRFLQRDEVEWIRVPLDPKAEPALATGTLYQARLVLRSGAKLVGLAEVSAAPGHARFLDMLNDGGRFFSLAAPDGIYWVNKLRLTEAELPSSFEGPMPGEAP